jgi:hypothetical protein
MTAEGSAKIGVCLRILGLTLEGLLVAYNRVPELSLHLEDIPQIIIGFGKIGLEMHCLPIAKDCCIQLTLDFECCAQVIVEDGDTRLRGDGFTDELYGKSIIPALTGENSE